MVESISASLFPELKIGGGVSRDRVLDFYGGFKSELGNLMQTLIDPDADLELDGFKLDASSKNGAAGTYLINEWLSEQEFIFSQLLESYKFEQTLENKINNFSFS